MEGVTDLCLWPFLAIRRGEAIHLPDRDAVRDHFASAIEAYRFAAGIEKWTPLEIDARQLGEHSVFATVHWNALDADGTWSETPGRATNCSRRRRVALPLVHESFLSEQACRAQTVKGHS